MYNFYSTIWLKAHMRYQIRCMNPRNFDLWPATNLLLQLSLLHLQLILVDKWDIPLVFNSSNISTLLARLAMEMLRLLALISMNVDCYHISCSMHDSSSARKKKPSSCNGLCTPKRIIYFAEWGGRSCGSTDDMVISPFFRLFLFFFFFTLSFIHIANI